MSTIVDGMARLLAGSVGHYDPDAVTPEGQTPITLMMAPTKGDLAVTLATYPGGPEPDSRNGWEYPRLQVRVRSEDPNAALVLDRDCYDALQAASGPLPGGGWVLQDCYALNSEAQPLGPDANGRHEFTRNYQLTVHLAS